MQSESMFHLERSAIHFVKTTAKVMYIPKFFFFTMYIIPLKTKRRPLYLKTQSVPRSKHISSRL